LSRGRLWFLGPCGMPAMIQRPTKYKIHFKKRSRKAKDQPKYRYKHEEVEYPGPVTFTYLHHIHTYIL
jgi:hypothetical protein